MTPKSPITCPCTRVCRLRRPLSKTDQRMTNNLHKPSKSKVSKRFLDFIWLGHQLYMFIFINNSTCERSLSCILACDFFSGNSNSNSQNQRSNELFKNRSIASFCTINKTAVLSRCGHLVPNKQKFLRINLIRHNCTRRYMIMGYLITFMDKPKSALGGKSSRNKIIKPL